MLEIDQQVEVVPGPPPALPLRTGDLQIPVVLPEPAGPTERLTCERRRSVYEDVGLTEAQIIEIESMIARSPCRDVGGGALQSIKGVLQSKKNGARRLVESHTCELTFAHELELDPTVLGYYTQVPCAGIERVRGERRHVSAAALDFLVLRERSIQLVECKYDNWLEKEAKKPNADYRREGNNWTHAPYWSRAKALGLNFMVWFQTTPMALQVQNLEACYALLGESLTPQEDLASRRARQLLQEYPRSIETLNAVLPVFNERVALWMIANGHAYGLVKSSSPVIREGFYLFASKTQAAAADEFFYAQLRSGFDQPQISGDPILCATTSDIVRAEGRLQRLRRISLGQEPATVRMTQLAKIVADKIAAGQSPLAACLTNYSNCGQNTPSPLTEGQRKGIDHVINELWNKGKRNTIAHLWLDLDAWCSAAGEQAPSQTTLGKRVAEQDPRKRALARGGLRQFHAVRPRTGSDKRSLPPLGYGYLLAIDSSQFDNRCASNLITLFPAEKPRFYIGMDGATEEAMAHAFIFGPARTDGLAILIREYVFRHGFLPRAIMVDRGSENTSNWIDEFCEAMGIALFHAPSGGSQFNGQAENAIKQTNANTAHRIAGSTEPDMAGRKVDGRFKSRKTARHTFGLIHQEFCDYLYTDIPRTPDGNGITPQEKREELLATLGCMGVPQQFDDAFLIQTSAKLKRKVSASEHDGVRTGDGRFTSDELQRVLRTESVDEIRSDCVDPSILWVKAGRGWWKACHRSAPVVATLPEPLKLFELLFRPYAKRRQRVGKRDVAKSRHARQMNAFEAMESTKHLGPVRESLPDAAAPLARATAEKKRAAVDWDAVPECKERK
ncbi:putative transposase [Tahibacter aquaticus]|uniref:Putative transposase n=1 Tax=Tahibacter aquaticus TaxID=520092 RepID=A0A4R6Z6I4_9GAMM|nr:transposase family protein [Tahibacter aquaticus]TDR47355.1 putative transposase [Tahibacter aquaticus]